MNNHTVYQHNDLKVLMKYNDSNDMEMNLNLPKGGVGSVIGLINSHNLPQFNESSNLEYINWGV